MQTFRGVTAPLIMPTTLFVLVNALIGAFRFVDHVIVLTKGGPDNATMLLLHDRYRQGGGRRLSRPVHPLLGHSRHAARPGNDGCHHHHRLAASGLSGKLDFVCGTSEIIAVTKDGMRE